MGALKKTVLAFFACVLAFVIIGCSGQSSQPEPPSGGEGVTIEEVAGASGYKITLDGVEDQIPSVEVTLGEGEGLIVMGMLDAGNIEAAESKGGEWFSTDYLYEEYSFAVTYYDPGTYTIDFTVNEASTGTIYVLGMHADGYDFDNSDAETLFQQTLDMLG